MNMERMSDEEYRNHILEAQFSIPRKLNYLADKYPTTTWSQAKKLYRRSVEELLKEFEVDCILDIGGGYGKGFVMASALFESKLQREYAKTEKG